jgi:iron complex outermembrane receptor protein
MKSSAITLTVVVALHASFSFAADDSAGLEELIVTARRILTPGLGAESLDAVDIARMRARSGDTASLLLGIPGVAVYAAGGVSGLPAIRGLADDRLRTQVDGVDIAAACPNHMNPPLSYIDPTAVAAVDVYAGVTPVSVGGDSIGGSILVRSADPMFAPAGERSVGGEAGTFYRSNGDGWGGNVAATYATERLSLGYTGAYRQSGNFTAGDGFKDYTYTGRADHTLATDQVGSTAYESRNQSLRVAWRSHGHMLDFSYSHQDIPEELYPNQRMDMTGNTASKFNLSYTGRLGGGTLQARAYLQETEHAMDFGPDKRFWYGPGAPPAGSGGDTAVDGTPCTPISGSMPVNGLLVGCAAGMPMNADGSTHGYTLNAVTDLSERSVLRIGGEYQRFRLDDWWPASGAAMWPHEFLNINDGERDRYAVHGEWEVHRKRWSHNLGLRYERVASDAGPVHGYDSSSFPTSGTGGPGNQTRDAALFNAQSRGASDDHVDFAWIARYAPADTQSYEFGLARKTRSPNLYERYTWSSWQMAAFMNNTIGDGNGYFGDVDLVPEVAHTVSVTADWHDGEGTSWNLRITPYHTVVDDYIDAVQWDAAANAPRSVPVVGRYTVLRYANQAATLYGLDFSAAGHLARSARYGVFSAALVGSYTRGSNDDTDDNLHKIMPFNAMLSATQELGRWRNTVEGEFVAGRDDVSAVRNEIPTAGYGLIHLRSRCEAGRWNAELGVENLLDRRYEPPLGGAYLGQGTTMTVPPPPNQPQWGTAVPGPGRSIYAAVSVKF